MTGQHPPPDKKTFSCFYEEDYRSVIVIMGLMGAFFWAIRGTAGYGGAQGAALAGLGWALLWYFFSCFDGQERRRPYGAVPIIAAIIFGTALGGMTGYGVYTAWINGTFYLNHPEQARPIAPWTGYAMMFACGLHWGGISGAFMAWCAPCKPLAPRDWCLRIASGVLGAVAAGLLVRAFPQWFLPFYSEGLYDVPEYATCRRALGSIRTIAPHVGLFLGFLAFEAVRRDRRAVQLMALMALGFAIPFTVGGYWHTFRGSALPLDWWKNWEMTIGFGGGIAFGLAFYLFNRPGGVVRSPDSVNARIWGAAVPLWLASSIVFMGAYKGLVVIHELPWPVTARVAVSLCYVIPASVALVLYIRQQRRERSDPPIPFQACLGLMGLIIVAGYTVSIHRTPEASHYALLGLYTCYIAVSAVLFALLWKEYRPLRISRKA